MYDSYPEPVKIIEQEYIPVGWVPPALYRTESGLSDKEPPRHRPPPPHTHTEIPLWTDKRF